jgi:2,5-diamino-6-(ribosylamino)-4(3H)-pyrimidinone 5'-phosphate reductase
MKRAKTFPRVILYNAVSVDGRFDWFTPDIGQFYGLVSTWKEDVTLVGSNTILSAPAPDVPEDEAAFEPPKRNSRDKRPMLVIVDSRGRVRHWHALRQAGYWRDVAALVSRTTPKKYRDYLEKRHIDCIVAGHDRVRPMVAMEKLRERYGAKTVRIDSGGTLNGVFLRAGLVDEVSLLVHPSLVGGTTPKSIFRAEDLTSSKGVIDLKLTHVKKMKNGLVWLRYQVAR